MVLKQLFWTIVESFMLVLECGTRENRSLMIVEMVYEPWTPDV